MKAEAPKKILENLGRVAGDEYAWLEHLKVDWGDGKSKDTFIPRIPDGVFALPITEKGKLILVHQYRFSGGGWTYEVPGGIIDKDEDEEYAVLRELEEEAGQKAAELRKISTIRPHATYPTLLHLYVAEKLTKTKQHLDAGEKGLTVHEFTPKQVWEMIMDGTIRDAKTIAAFFLAKELGIIHVKKKLEKHPF